MGRSHVRGVKSESANNLPSVPSAAATTNIVGDYVSTVAHRRLPIVQRLPVRKLQLLSAFWNRWCAIDWPFAWGRRTSASSGNRRRVRKKFGAQPEFYLLTFPLEMGPIGYLLWLDNDMNILTREILTWETRLVDIVYIGPWKHNRETGKWVCVCVWIIVFF